MKGKLLKACEYLVHEKVLVVEAREQHNSKDHQQVGPEPLFFAEPALFMRKLLPVLCCLV